MCDAELDNEKDGRPPRKLETFTPQPALLDIFAKGMLNQNSQGEDDSPDARARAERMEHGLYDGVAGLGMIETKEGTLPS